MPTERAIDMLSRAVALLPLVIGILVAQTPASAAPGNVLVLTESPALGSDSDGLAEIKLQVVNISDEPVVVSLESGSNPEACRIELASPPTLPPGIQRSLTVEANHCPNQPGATVSFTLVAGSLTLPVVAVRQAPAAQVQLETLLRDFGLAAVAGLVVAVLVFAFFNGGNADRRTWRTRIPLPATWSLSESWASNLTVLAAGLGGIFGASNVLQGVFGADVGGTVAAATVAGAVAVAIVAAAPLLIGAARGKEGVPVWALLLGAALTLTAAIGQWASICRAVDLLDLQLGTNQPRFLLAVAVAGAGLLMWYVGASLVRILKDSPLGTSPPVAILGTPVEYGSVADYATLAPIAGQQFADAVNALQQAAAARGLTQEQVHSAIWPEAPVATVIMEAGGGVVGGRHSALL